MNETICKLSCTFFIQYVFYVLIFQSVLPTFISFVFQLNQRYSSQHRPSSESHDSVEELRNAFELAERSSPGITEHFIQLIFTRLQPNGAEDRARSHVDRLTRKN